MATWGCCVPALSVSMSVVAVPHPPDGVYRFAQMLVRVPSDWLHTATALPLPSIATWGDALPALSVSMSAAVPHPPDGVYRFAQMLFRVPSDWIHTATALPLPSMATWGDVASPLSVSMSVAVPHPPDGVYRFAQMLFRVPSDCYHTATALPLPSIATCGEVAFHCRSR